MSDDTHFEVAVGDNAVAVVLRGGEAGADRARRPAVLVCAEPPHTAIDESVLRHAVATDLAAAGLLVAEYEPRWRRPGAEQSIKDAIDEASAVFRWLLLREDVDTRCVGLFAVGLGAVIASGLVGRTDQFNRVCLLSPATLAGALARRSKPGRRPPLLDEHVTDAMAEALVDTSTADDLALHEHETLLLHGAADRVVLPAASRTYATALERAGRHVRHELIAHGDHELSLDVARRAALDRITEFLGAMSSDAVRPQPA